MTFNFAAFHLGVIHSIRTNGGGGSLELMTRFATACICKVYL